MIIPKEEFDKLKTEDKINIKLFKINSDITIFGTLIIGFIMLVLTLLFKLMNETFGSWFALIFSLILFISALIKNKQIKKVIENKYFKITIKK